MKKIVHFLIVLSLAVEWSCNRIEDELPVKEENSYANAKDGDIVPGQYIVRLKDGATSLRSAKLDYSTAQLTMRNEVQKILEASTISSRDPLFVYTSAIEGFAVKLTDAEVKSLKKNEAVLSISPDRVIALGKPGSQPSSYPSPQVVPWGVLRVHGIAQYNGTNKVWIIDSGIDLDHPDLNVSQDLGASFVSPGTDDGNGHGTACAGIIAAKNDKNGVVGVAPGALVVPVKVLDNSGNGTVSATLAGVDYVATHAAENDVVNMCIGTSIEPTLDNAVRNMVSDPVKSLFVAIPAGSGSTDADNVSPARTDHPNIFTVSSYDESDHYCEVPGFPLSRTSNYGSHVDFSGPGERILTTYRNGSLCYWTGSSMSAAHMAGILLVTGGNPITDGWIINDLDNYPDPIAVAGPESQWDFDPTVTTSDISAINSTSAYSGAVVISDGGAAIREAGVCWGTSENPDITNEKDKNDIVNASFMTGLQPGTRYYVRAFATNLTGTSYGDQKIFTTPVNDNPIVFNTSLTYGLLSDNDGNTYNTIKIGTKTWMAENLRTTKFNDGSVIPLVQNNIDWAGSTGPAYCWYNNNEINYGNLYGALYNWYAVSPAYNGNKNICPTGWHVPSKDEYSALIKSLGGESIGGGKLKEAGTDHWVSPNAGATNSSGFTLMPGGMRYSDYPKCWWTYENMAFDYIHQFARYWTLTEYPREQKNAYALMSDFTRTIAVLGIRGWGDGYSVRCVKD